MALQPEVIRSRLSSASSVPCHSVESNVSPEFGRCIDEGVRPVRPSNKYARRRPVRTAVLPRPYDQAARPSPFTSLRSNA